MVKISITPAGSSDLPAPDVWTYICICGDVTPQTGRGQVSTKSRGLQLGNPRQIRDLPGMTGRDLS